MPIYLDYAATTPLRPEARAAMEPCLAGAFGNPSSQHAFGRAARDCLDAARDLVARCLNAHAGEITFTSGGTEADNLAITGAARSARSRGAGTHVIVSAVEHHAVLHAALALADDGFSISLAPVDRHGRVDPEDARRLLRPDTVLVSVMAANNEVGTLQPIAEIGALCREHGVPLHTDAVQAAGLIHLDVDRLPVDLLSLSAHKFYGPKGIGALYVRAGTELAPILRGGAQERERRAGTEAVAAACGMAAALELAVAERPVEAPRLADLRDRLAQGLRGAIDRTWLNGPESSERLPGIANIAFEGIDAEALLIALDLAGVAAAAGAACSSGALEPSHVLAAMGLPAERLNGSVRFSLGRGTTGAEIDAVLNLIPAIVRRLRRRTGAAH